MGRAVELFGRSSDLARIEAGLATGAVVLHGPTGVGKSALARRIQQRSEAVGTATIWVQGSPGMVDVPLGALLTHLARDRAADASTATEPAALAERLLRSLPGADPLCVVDDVQWVDDLTLAVIHHLHLSGGARTLLTLREGERLSEAARALSRVDTVERVSIGPLDTGVMAELVDSLVGGQADPSLVDQLTRRAEGNPLFVTELVAGARSK